MRRAAVCCALGVAVLSVAACGELEPMNEPEVADLQLTVETLKTQIRDAQRTMTELRTELEARRQELAEARVVRAQLEGRVREAERRVVEARHVIDLQREELMAARTERERISKSSLQLQGQIKQLEKYASKSRPFMDSGQGIAPTSRDRTSGRAQKASASPFPAEAAVGLSGGRAVTPADGRVGIPAADFSAAEHQAKGARLRAISVKPGDTLWSISRNYRIGLDQLRALNRLTDNRIEVGQAIWVPADRITGSAVTPNP